MLLTERSPYTEYTIFLIIRIFKISRDTEHISSHYSVLSSDDYIELSNIDLSKMLQSYKDLIRFKR